MTNNAGISILTTSLLSCNSSMLLYVLQFYSASSCSAILLLLLCIQHLLLIYEFYLTLRILSVSHCAYCNFPFLPVQIIFHSKQPIPHSHYVFLLCIPTTSVTPRIPRKTMLQPLNRQPSKNHDSILLTES
jgi:hypothetical protein